MPAAVIREPGAARIEPLPPLSWAAGCDSFALAVQAAAAALGVSASYADLKGLSAGAFRLIFDPAWRRYAPDALQGHDPTRMVYAALGLHAETIQIDPADEAARAEMRAVIRERVEAGCPLPGLQMMGWEDWGLIGGYAADGETLLIRTPHAPGEELAAARRWPWMVQAVRVVGPPPNRRGSAARALRVAVDLFETESCGPYRSGQAAYRAWIDGLRDAGFYAPYEAGSPRDVCGRAAAWLAAEAPALADDRPLSNPYLERAHVNAWRLKSLADARAAAAGFLESAAGLFGSEVGVRLSAAALSYREAAALAGTARAFAPSEFQLAETPWSQGLRDKQAALLEQALTAEQTAQTALRAGLARMRGM